jgi:EAL and modified HD-GYP domain-containing signal transduction protein
MPTAPVVDPVAMPSGDFFLARQPILGRDQKIVAYELLFRSAPGSGPAGVTDDTAATAAVIAHASQLGMQQVVGDSLALVNVDAAVLMSDFVRFLPNDKVILEILETVVATDEVLARVIELKEAGFRLALDDVIADSPDVQKFLPLVDVIKIDLRGLPSNALPGLVRQLKGADKKLLAEKVETVEEFNACLGLGFDYFQGFYFEKPVILSGKKIAPSELTILRLLDMINSDADNAEIEANIKRDALISLNLLRLVNTPAAGARSNIDSIGQALMILGRRQLQRWLQILLYAKPGAAMEFTSPLLQMATTRGKLLESMVRQLHPNQRTAADTAFSVGIMSLMDALFSMSLPDVLATVAVTDEVRDALMERKGELGEMLKVAELLERGAQDPALVQSLKRLGVSSTELHAMQLATFEWVNELANSVH